MLTKDNEYLQEAAESLYVANADEIIRQQCIAREDAERRERTLERNYRLAQEKLAEKELALEEKDSTILEQSLIVEEQKKSLEAQATVMEEQKNSLAEQALEIERLKALLEKYSK